LLCYKGKSPAKIIEISTKDYQPLSIIEDVGLFNHDVIITEEYLYTLSTKTGELVEYNRNNKTINRYKVCMDIDFWWVRGMKKINNSIYIFVGENWNKSERFPAVLVKEFDIDSKKILSNNILPLKGSCFQII
jgi:hypothetical protein